MGSGFSLSMVKEVFLCRRDCSTLEKVGELISKKIIFEVETYLKSPPVVMESFSITGDRSLSKGVSGSLRESSLIN